MFVLMLIYFGALLAMAVFLFDQLGDIYGFIKNLTNLTKYHDSSEIITVRPTEANK